MPRAHHKEQTTSTLKSPGNVYFITSGTHIKIGWAKDPDRRLAALQTASPVKLSLVYSFPGSGAKERELHAKFSHLRSSGEWFAASPEIFAAIDELRADPSPVPKWPDSFPKMSAPVVPPGYWEPGGEGWAGLVQASKALDW